LTTGFMKTTDGAVALQSILDSAVEKGREKIPLDKALGRVLGEDIVAATNLPPFDNSAMDGFAMACSDAAEGERFLSVVGESSAGNIFGRHLGDGEAVRVMTGGKIPEGADTVVPLEDARVLDDKRVGIMFPVRTGAHIRRCGEDVREGETILHEGELIRPPHLGILASLGNAKVRVRRKPVVNILATGDELVAFDEQPGEGQIRNSTSLALAGHVRESGGMPHYCGVVPDRREQIKKAIRKALNADVLLVTGGVSVGKYDFVKGVFSELGITTRFWRLNIKPGRPLVFGTFGDVLVFGLPGNPVSTSVTFLEFVRPAMWKMEGRRVLVPFRCPAVLDEEYVKSDGRRHYLRGTARLEGGSLRVTLTKSQSSGAMSTLTRGNCLVIVPEEVVRLSAGDAVEIEML
jgi:molybdopterin molybdotransferase